jgi:hypothetical protein
MDNEFRITIDVGTTEEGLVKILLEMLNLVSHEYIDADVYFSWAGDWTGNFIGSFDFIHSGSVREEADDILKTADKWLTTKLLGVT